MSWRFEFESGRRYTRSIPGTQEYPDGLIELDGVTYFIGTVEDDKPYYYLAKDPASNVDLKLYKKMSIGGVNLRWVAEVENLFNQRIPRRINPFTGREYNPGVIIPYSMIEAPNPNFDPSRFQTPRTAIIGFQVKF